MTTPQQEYLSCVDLACDRLDAIDEYGISEGDAPGLLVMHGVAMYARDTARAAVMLLRDGQTFAAGGLTRIVIEHAVLAQWLKVDPDTRGHLFLQQSEVEHARWFDVVLAASFDLTDPAHQALSSYEKERGLLPPKPKNVAKQFDTVKNLFGDTQKGRQFYLTYRHLSRFVHPSAITFGRYTSPLRFGTSLTTRVQLEQDPEAVSFYLASAIVMSALPYFEALGEVGAGATVGVAARRAEVPTSLEDT